MISAYLAADGFERQLEEELERAGVAVRARHGRLFVSDAPAVPAAWAVNIWHDCVELPVASIGEAAKVLRTIQRNWAMYAPFHHRRAALIQERLPHVSVRPIVFPAAAPAAPLGSWTLLAPGQLLAAARCSAPFPNGEVTFVEERSRSWKKGRGHRTGPISNCGKRWCACVAGRSPASAASISVRHRAAGPMCWRDSAHRS